MADFSEPEQVRKYLKENMAEGYLSQEEGMNIDKFVDEYSELLDLKQKTQEIIKQVHEDKVR